MSYGKATPLPAGDRPAQGVLPDRGPRRPAADPREGRPGKLLTLDRALEPTLPGAARAARRAGRRPGVAGARSRRSAGSGRSTRSSGCSCARARCSRCCSSSRTCTGSTPRPRRCSTAWWRACRPRALLLLVNYRPEYEHALGHARRTTRSSASIRCPPRAPRSCSRRCSATDPGSGPLKRLLIERTEGNPFFLEESVRTLVETGVLGGRARRLPAGAGRSRRIQVPATVQAVLAARIDRLPPEDKRLLQAAAVIGKDVPLRAARRRSPRLPEDGAAPGARPPAGRRVPLRDEPLPRPRVHLQARAHPRGRLRQPARRSGAARCTRASWARSSGCGRTD